MKDKSPTLSQLNYFVAVAKHENFRAAANQLGISQPTLTGQIATMEHAIGVTLFERSRSGTRLTPQGRSLLASAEKVLQASQRFSEQAASLSENSQTTYRLGVPPTLGPYLLPYILPDLHKTFPRLKFYVREAAPHDLEAALSRGEFDLIISPLSQDSEKLSSAGLFEEPLKFVVPSDHKLFGKSLINPSDLAGERVLTLENNHHFHYEVLQICDQLGARILKDYEGTSLDTLRQMVVMGMGVAFLPGLYIQSELHKPEALHVCEISNLPIVRKHSLVWRTTSANRVFYRELVVLLRQVIAQRLGAAVSAVD